LRWGKYLQNLKYAKAFHNDIKDAYHPHTYVFYGKDKKVPSFEGIHWQLKRGIFPPDGKTPPVPEQVREMGFDEVRDEGKNPLRVGGQLEVFPGAQVVNSSYWDLVCAKQDGGGDGTVPASSGAFSLRSANALIQQQFGLTGIEHEPAYRDPTARFVTLYALQKIAAKAKVKT